MNDIVLKICRGGQELAASDTGAMCYAPTYQPGDTIQLEVPAPGYYVIQLDDAMGEELVYMKETIFSLGIPFEEARISYSPRAFAGKAHYLTARAARAEEIAAHHNLARNVYDCHGNTVCYPHAWANVETRGESVFAARNAIDGVICPTCHGEYPYESWGINRDPNACWTLELGRPVKAETLILYTRADFPHDAWWTGARLTLSNGKSLHLPLKKTADAQMFPLHGEVITSLMLDELKKSEDPSPFPALTQVQLLGTNL